jgi:hypothetical protein
VCKHRVAFKEIKKSAWIKTGKVCIARIKAVSPIEGRVLGDFEPATAAFLQKPKLCRGQQVGDKILADFREKTLLTLAETVYA